MIGKKIAHFIVVDKLGEGGMGVVYRARDENLDREVALKVLPPDFVGDDERRARFIREAQTAAAVTHPNIATIHEVGDDDGVAYIAMELVEGQTLDHRCDGSLGIERVLAIGIEIGEGLARAHESKVVHRDLKPENVALAGDGHVKILDFGLAKLYEVQQSTGNDASDIQTMSVGVTRDGRILGTAAYMSPEQARGLNLDARSDIFSFGVLLYEMVTGRTPFHGKTITDTLSSILRDTPPPIAEFNTLVPAELERIIGKCLAKNPDDRYQQAQEIVVDLRNLKRVSDSQSVPLVSLSGAQLRARPRWMIPAAVGGAVVATLALAAWGLGVLFGSAAPVAPVANSLAVMPFENRQEPDDPERVGQILQELIITDLSGEGGLKVFSSQRLFDLQRQLGRSERATGTIDSDLASEVARRAGAGTMLSGSISQLGDRWILTSQLVDMTDGTVLKSERIDGSDLYTMVDDLTSRIHGDLGLIQTAGGMTDVAVSDRTSTSLKAYQHFLDGIDLLNAREFDEAGDAFAKSIQIDPYFGQAYYKMAIARWWERGPGADPRVDGGPAEILDNLLDGDLKLAEKDRKLAEAFLALVEGEYDQAKPLFTEVTQLDPDDKEAWYGLGEAVFHGSASPDTRQNSLEAFERAVTLDPEFRLASAHLIDLYTERGDAGIGAERVMRMLEGDPNDVSLMTDLARLSIMDGDAEQTAWAVEQGKLRIEEPEQLGRFLSQVAAAYGQRGEIDAVRELVEEGLELAGDNVAVCMGAGEFNYYTHEYAQAEHYFQKARASAPDVWEPVRGLLRVYEREARFDESLELTRQVRDEFPVVDVLPWQIQTAVQIGDPEEIRVATGALDAIVDDEATDRHVKDKLLWAARNAYMDVGDYVQANDYAHRALALDPRNSDPGQMLRLGWNALMLDELDVAAQWFTRAAEREPGEALGGLGRISLRQGDADEALRYFERAAGSSVDPDDSDAQLVKAYIRANRLEKAEQLLDDLVARLPTDMLKRELLKDAADIYLQRGIIDPAYEALERAERLDDAGLRDPRMARYMVRALIGKQRYDEARRRAGQGLEVDPANFELRAGEAVLSMLEGDPESAERAIRAALDRGPIHRYLYQALAYSLVEQGRFQEAMAPAQQAMRMDPSRASHTLMAWILIRGDIDIDRGIELAVAAQRITPPIDAGKETLPFVASPEHCLGLAYLKRGDFDRARELLDKAAIERPDRPSIQDDLRRAKARESVARR